jgi:hypothetical protein
MSRRYALKGSVSGELLTFGGLVLVHGDRAEMEYLFAGTQVVEIGPQIPECDTMLLAQHPDIAGKIRFPLRREDFVQ